MKGVDEARGYVTKTFVMDHAIPERHKRQQPSFDPKPLLKGKCGNTEKASSPAN